MLEIEALTDRVEERFETRWDDGYKTVHSTRYEYLLLHVADETPGAQIG